MDEISLGGGYFGHAAKWKPSGGSFSVVKVGQKQIYGQILDSGLGFAERSGWFLRLGAADFDDGAGFKDGYKPFGSIGFKDVWYGGSRAPFQVGTVFLGSYYSPYETEASFESGKTFKAKVKSRWDLGFAVSAQWNPSRWLSFYGGPTASYVRAGVTREGAGIADKTTYKANDIAGFVGGIRLGLSRRWMVCAEGQYRGEISGGAAFFYSFD
jgi:hypothetical protein